MTPTRMSLIDDDYLGDHAKLELFNEDGCNACDGTGYYATYMAESRTVYKYGGPHPEWATHVMWYNK